MNKQRVKKLYGKRRDQTARLLQQTHRIAAFVASTISEPDLCNVDRMNVILATENPTESVVETKEVAGKMIMGIAVGFPSLVLGFLYERFRDDVKIMKLFEEKLRGLELEKPKGLRIVRLRGKPKDYYIN